MSDSIHFRQATSDDLAELQRLEAQFPGDRLSPRQLRFHTFQSDGRLRVMVEVDRIVGYSLVLRRAGSRIARLYSFVIDQSSRGRGFGRRLLCDAEAIAQMSGADEMRLEVRADNLGAIALYRREGFRDIGKRLRYYEDDCDALKLAKRFGP